MTAEDRDLDAHLAPLPHETIPDQRETWRNFYSSQVACEVCGSLHAEGRCQNVTADGMLVDDDPAQDDR